MLDRLDTLRASGGVSFGLSEMRPGACTMACPIIGRDNEPVAAIIVAGLSLDDELHADSALAQHARRTATSISSALRAG